MGLNYRTWCVPVDGAEKSGASLVMKTDDDTGCRKIAHVVFLGAGTTEWREREREESLQVVHKPVPRVSDVFQFSIVGHFLASSLVELKFLHLVFPLFQQLPTEVGLGVKGPQVNREMGKPLLVTERGSSDPPSVLVPQSAIVGSL